jgi:hypothetical protein
MEHLTLLLDGSSWPCTALLCGPVPAACVWTEDIERHSKNAICMNDVILMLHAVIGEIDNHRAPTLLLLLLLLRRRRHT